MLFRSIHAVNREGGQVLGFECSASLQSVGRDVDLALVAVPDEALVEVVTDAATVGVRGLVIVTDPEHGRLARRREVVAAAREGGMRIIGPAALGIINTDPEVRLNASLAPEVPRRDSIGFFCQSGALGIDILARVQQIGRAHV